MNHGLVQIIYYGHHFKFIYERCYERLTVITDSKVVIKPGTFTLFNSKTLMNLIFRKVYGTFFFTGNFFLRKLSILSELNISSKVWKVYGSYLSLKIILVCSVCQIKEIITYFPIIYIFKVVEVLWDMFVSKIICRVNQIKDIIVFLNLNYKGNS